MSDDPETPPGTPPTPPAAASVGTPGARPCPAGQDCKGQYEHEEPLFRGKDYFFMAIGISSRPVPIQRKCALCNHVWEVTEPRRPW